VTLRARGHRAALMQRAAPPMHTPFHVAAIFNKVISFIKRLLPVRIKPAKNSIKPGTGKTDHVFASLLLNLNLTQSKKNLNLQSLTLLSKS